MPSPFTTPVAVSTPFEPLRNPGFGGLSQPFTSTNVQDAIEEALDRAISNDRFLVLPNYGGNANVGRYLEFFPGQASGVSPIYLVAAAKILAVTLQTTAANATCNVGIFDLNVSSVTPIYTIVMTAQKRVAYVGTPVTPLGVTTPGALLALRVTSGSINTPTCQLTFSAAT